MEQQPTTRPLLHSHSQTHLSRGFSPTMKPRASMMGTSRTPTSPQVQVQVQTPPQNVISSEESQAIRLLENMLEEKLVDDNTSLYHILRSGVLLCRLANKISGSLALNINEEKSDKARQDNLFAYDEVRKSLFGTNASNSVAEVLYSDDIYDLFGKESADKDLIAHINFLHKLYIEKFPSSTPTTSTPIPTTTSNQQSPISTSPDINLSDSPSQSARNRPSGWLTSKPAEHGTWRRVTVNTNNALAESHSGEVNTNQLNHSSSTNSVNSTLSPSQSYDGPLNFRGSLEKSQSSSSESPTADSIPSTPSASYSSLPDIHEITEKEEKGGIEEESSFFQYVVTPKKFLEEEPEIDLSSSDDIIKKMKAKYEAIIEDQKKRHEEEIKKLEDQLALEERLKKDTADNMKMQGRKDEKQIIRELNSVVAENTQLKQGLESLRAEVKRLHHDKAMLSERTKVAVTVLEQQNRQMRIQIEDMQVQLEAAKKEKKSLIDRITELSVGGPSNNHNSLRGVQHSNSSPNLLAEESKAERVRKSTVFTPSFLSKSLSIDQSEASPTASVITGPLILDEEGIIYSPYKGKMEIKGGTKNKLISKLYTPSDQHSVPEYVATFLLTYRSFMSPKELLDLLIEQYNQCIDTEATEQTLKEEHGKIRIRICNFLKRWMEGFFDDFAVDTHLQDAFVQFIQHINEKNETDKSLASMLEKAINRKRNGEIMNRQVIFAEPSPPSLLPIGAINIDSLSSVEIARQLTIVEFEMFQKIQPKELLNLSWMAKDKEEKSPSVLRMIRKFNEVSGWVTSTMLLEANLKRRQRLLKKFVSIAEECYKLNNFNAIFEITSGLTKSSVFRLNKTWECVRGKGTFFDVQEALTSNKGNFKFYKEKLLLCNPPCCPYLGIYLSTLTFLEEGNPNTLENDYINFFKRRLVAEIIKEIQQYQQTPYNLTPVPSIVQYLTKEQRVIDEGEAFKQSLAIEPRENQ